MVVKTISLKLRAPSRAKRELLDDALERYTKAFAHLLVSLDGKLDGLDLRRKGAVRAVADKALLKELNVYGAQPFKDALLMDVGMALSVYCAHKNAEGTSPLVRLDDGEFSRRFAILCEEYEDSTDFLRGYDALMKKRDALRPILFCRHDPNRDYCLLHDEKKNRFYAKLYLQNGEAARARPAARGAAPVHLRAVGRPDAAAAGGERHPRYAVVPLEFGAWQREYLRRAQCDPSMLRTAQLVKKGKDYYLNIRMAFRPNAPRQAAHFLGVCRALGGALHYAVVDGAGNPIESGPVLPTGGEAAVQPQKALLHSLANTVIALARRTDSRIVLYALGDRTDALECGGQRAPLSRGAYNAFAAMTRYKAELGGLQPPALVSPVGVFHTCPVCGRSSRKNRMNESLFLCTLCGHSHAAQELGSLNLARRLIRYRQSKVPFAVERCGGQMRFINKTLGFDEQFAASPAVFDAFFGRLGEFLRAQADSLAQGVELPVPKRAMLDKLWVCGQAKDAVRFLAP